MINLHESKGPGVDRTHDPWVCSPGDTVSVGCASQPPDKRTQRLLIKEMELSHDGGSMRGPRKFCQRGSNFDNF